MFSVRCNACNVSEEDDPLMEGDYRERPCLALVNLVFVFIYGFCIEVGVTIQFYLIIPVVHLKMNIYIWAILVTLRPSKM